MKLLVDMLCAERGISAQDAGLTYSWQSFRTLVNTREPWPAHTDLLALQDAVLQKKIAEAGITDASSLSRCPGDRRLSIWRGDITVLKVDAVVNAANSQMLGCWVPGHHCIDNAIHTFAGIQLRVECDRLMQQQGFAEPVGTAKITSAYNLPSSYVLHTVGPTVKGGSPSDAQRQQLAGCYLACLDLAEKHGLRSVAFCCIGTGVFGFPQAEAAPIALDAVRRWLDKGSRRVRHVVFDVFTEHDEALYHALLD